VHHPGYSHKPRQLLVDVSVLAVHDAGTGIQRVVRSILAELQGRDIADVDVRPIAADGRTSYRYLPIRPDARWGAALDLASLPEVQVGSEDIFLGLDLATVSLRIHERQLASWRASGARMHLVVYDLLPLRHPGWFRRRTRRNYRRWLGVIERNAHEVICISRYVASDFKRWLARPKLTARRPIVVTSLSLGGNIEASSPSLGLPGDAAEVLAWMKARETVLMVGTVEPRKAYDRALPAFERLWASAGAEAPQLAIVGRPGWKTARLQRRLRQLSGLQGPCLWLDDVSDEFLGLLYQASAGVLFATHAEGFGLPMVEALAKGKRVLARDHPALRELAAPGVTFFGNDAPRELGETVQQWLRDEAVSKIEPQASRSWSDATSDLLTLLGLADQSATAPGA